MVWKFVGLSWLMLSAAAQVKPPMVGVVAMGSLHFQANAGEAPNNSLQTIYARAGTIDGVAINVTWAQLQPKAGVLDRSALEAGLADVRKYNQKYPKTPLAVKLRVFSGISAPEWAKRLGGDPISMRTRGGGGATIGRFWSKPYRDAWKQLQTALAKRYDDEPLIRETSITSCVVLGDEPFIAGEDPALLTRVSVAGFTDAAYRDCLMNAPDDYAAWQNTRIDYPFNPFQSEVDGKRMADMAFTLSVMRAFREKLGERAAFQNHGLVVPLREGAKPIYKLMVELGPPLELQMFSPDTGYWIDAVNYAITTMKINEVELWTPSQNGQGFLAIPEAVLKKWSAEMKANPANANPGSAPAP